MSSSSGARGGTFLEEIIVIISGNILLQVVYGVYMVFLSGVFTAGISPLFLAAFGSLTTAVIHLPAAVFLEKMKWPTNVSFSLMSQFFLLSLGGVTLYQVLLLEGIKKASPNIASAMPNLAPGFVFIIAACLRLERFEVSCQYSRTKIIGTSVCLTGAVAMCFLQSSPESPTSAINLLAFSAKPLAVDNDNSNDWILGCFCILAGVVFLSCSTILQAMTMLEFAAPLSLVAITSMMGSFFTVLFQFSTQGKISAGSSTLNTASIVGIVILNGAVPGVCTAFQTWSINKKGPVLVAIFSPVQTVTTVVLSTLLLGHFISFGSFAGAILMFTGLYLVLWAKKNEDSIELDVNTSTTIPVEDVEKPLVS